MSDFWAFTRYLYLKVLVTLSRLLIKLLASPQSSKLDYKLDIPSRDKNRTIKVHVYKPPVTETGSSTPAPVLINLYGSGLAIPLHGLDDDFCRFIADTTGYVVLDVNYCLAPEYPFPKALNDVEDTLKYVLDHPKEYQASRVSISGFSSGGTLALSASASLPRGTFTSLIAFYPATNLYQDPSLRKAPVPGGKDRSPFWTRIFRESYIRGMDARDPRISPAFADTTNFPSNMLIVTGELDASAIEAEELAERAKDEGHTTGREVIIRRMKGCGHAFDKKLTGEVSVKAKNETYELAAKILKNGLKVST
ncbi:carboxylesterase, putative [Talaromyces stipitatus ATCC 10500]|uniref:Carboxylesterase, putative n=1 Tax=Talaromyces stipitatus (strain ATCC 10500 / CBS 375.48 / QM 6759 / NRRL 1006) TaxID=441959 RepID=B8M8E1_TALSN|nr:carboxylesterase, putative [Talaromyces stipitatus ATCC 10500]EED20454.1 carboxylesterase, putative [Talaromyces stipitatus ATCC 10500]